jgi:hypothetical protein
MLTALLHVVVQSCESESAAFLVSRHFREAHDGWSYFAISFDISLRVGHPASKQRDRHEFGEGRHTFIGSQHRTNAP